MNGGSYMIVYSVIMFLCAAIFVGIGIAIFRGKTDLIHSYHQTKVTDQAGYGKAFGKAMLVIATALLLSGIMALLDDFAVFAVGILILGIVIGVGCIIAVQRKFNKGVF